MLRPHLPLNALRAFEASARHLSFTKAAIELCVTQAAISHQVKGLEERLGVELFRRLPRGLALTDEGRSLLPTLRDSFDRIAGLLERFETGRPVEVLNVGAVGTFALGWLLPRLAGFRQAQPQIDLRLTTNNNRVDLAAEGLDYALRFGGGAWHGTAALRLFEAPMTPVCAPSTASALQQPSDLSNQILLRSYRADEWKLWSEAAGIEPLQARGPVFDTSIALAEVAAAGEGVALVPALLFSRYFEDGRLVRPFPVEVSLGSYWLTWLQSRSLTPAMQAFRDWLVDESRKQIASPVN
ncbi:LysR family transcriptional regulator, regulator of gene expression of beta-lactamase [Bosea sp. CRIB-10]|uniref:LysR family transcriptional regulator n=1 Tax=Bosea sp. CRIB-10 TaxID=378404 RepID=UPI0008ED0E26|nr:LysR family transcriptional regulator [Bosea sp. CRIB-10]SFC70010.1 LysR family transcriptional regulator, regulator of gene expression of beta-lactamase [Bosea sp. CRIB-10]